MCHLRSAGRGRGPPLPASEPGENNLISPAKRPKAKSESSLDCRMCSHVSGRVAGDRWARVALGRRLRPPFPLSSKKGTIQSVLRVSPEKWLKSHLESGPDCLTCASFAGRGKGRGSLTRKSRSLQTTTTPRPTFGPTGNNSKLLTGFLLQNNSRQGWMQALIVLYGWILALTVLYIVRRSREFDVQESLSPDDSDLPVPLSSEEDTTSIVLRAFS